MNLASRCEMPSAFNSDSCRELELAAAAGATSRRSARARMLAISSCSGPTDSAMATRVSRNGCH
eukprot:13647191-Alexandrium_andersonii.AAC.1